MLYIKLKINNCEVNNKFKIERSGIYLLSVSVLVQGILNYYPNYPTHRLYFREVKTPYKQGFLYSSPPHGELMQFCWRPNLFLTH